MRRTYPLWLLALLLKFAGASWDVSWHFRTVRETVSLPHVLNGAGEVLFVALFWHEWRQRTPARMLGLRVILAGMLLWAVAVPIDEVWHRLYGLDLTTWSPSHLMLFYGTGVAIAGLVLMFLGDCGWRPGRPLAMARASFREKMMLAAFMLFAAEAFLFPLTYNEHTTIAVDTAATDPSALDPEILALALTVADPYFHGMPAWLYPVYCIGAVAAIAIITRRILGRGWGLAILGGYVALRLVVDAALGATAWPRSVVPWQYVAMGAAWEAAWFAPRARLRAQAMVGAVLSTAAAYAAWVTMPRVMLAIPISTASWPGGIMAALVGAMLGWLAWDAAMAPPREEPLRVSARRAWTDVNAQARSLVARRR